MLSFGSFRHVFVLLLVFVAWSVAISVNAQGLVGAPVDPRYNPPVDGLAAPTYEGASGMVLKATGLAVLVALLLAGYRSRKVSGKRLAKELILFLLIPLAIYYGGLFSIRDVGVL